MRAAGLQADRSAEAHFLLERQRAVSDGQRGIADLPDPEDGAGERLRGRS
jgi:hypothetical protein